MHRDPRAFLWDVRESGLSIQAFTQGIDAAGYAANAMVQAAVERKFEIMGEALNQLSRLDPALASRIPQMGQIIAFRNQLIHGYAKVNVLTVWGVVQTSLPELLACVRSLLTEAGEG
jgi:uncharacterized protein with HEPN domain